LTTIKESPIPIEKLATEDQLGTTLRFDSLSEYLDSNGLLSSLGYTLLSHSLKTTISYLRDELSEEVLGIFEEGYVAIVARVFGADVFTD